VIDVAPRDVFTTGGVVEFVAEIAEAPVTGNMDEERGAR
jgi:hypothetical protein